MGNPALTFDFEKSQAYRLRLVQAVGDITGDSQGKGSALRRCAQIGDVAIEVTINQPDKRHLDQISRLIEDTSLQIWLVVRLTDREKWRNAVDAAFESPQRQRILVTDVETYLCHNVTERGNFLATGTRDTLNRILDIYNDRWLPAAGAGGLRIVSGDPETD